MLKQWSKVLRPGVLRESRRDGTNFASTHCYNSAASAS